MGQDNTTRRGFLKATGVAAATALSSTTTAAAADTETRPSNRTLNLEIGHEITSLDPVQSVNVSTSWVLEQLLDGLTTFPDGETRPRASLASGFEVSDDYQTYRFTIDKHARFHGGYGPVTAADVVYSFERIAASPHSFREGFILDLLGVEHERDNNGKYVPGSMAVEAIDTRTVEIRLQDPFHGVLEILAYASFGIVPEGIVGDIDGYDGDLPYQEFAQAPVGTGPFAIESKTADEITATCHPKYHGTKPWVERIRWRIIYGGDKLGRILDGEIDIWSISGDAFDPDLRTVERTRADGTEFGTYGPMENGEVANFQSTPGLSIYYLGFNCENVPRPVRRALAYVVNQTELTETLWNGAIPAAHFTPPQLYPGGGTAYDAHAADYPYGQAESRVADARSVMEDAGYGAENRYEMTLSVYSGETMRRFGDWLGDLADDAYIDITTEQTAFIDLTRNLVPSGAVDAFFLGWAADWPGAENFLQLLYPPYTDLENSKQFVSGFDWGGTPAAQEATDAFEQILANQGPSDSDTAVRNRAYEAIETANWTDVAAVPLIHSAETRYWYDWVDVTPFGGMGPNNQKYTEVKLRPKQSSHGNGKGR